jgi:hypothetical protein
MILITRKIIEPIDNKILLITIFQLQIIVIILFQIKNSIILIMISSLQTT